MVVAAGTCRITAKKQRRRGTAGQRTYDTNSPFQVVGAGSLNQAADRYLTEEEPRVFYRNRCTWLSRSTLRGLEHPALWKPQSPTIKRAAAVGLFAVIH